MRIRTGMRSAPARVEHRQRAALSGLLSQWVTRWLAKRSRRASRAELQWWTIAGQAPGTRRQLSARQTPCPRSVSWWCCQTTLLLTRSGCVLMCRERTGPSWYCCGLSWCLLEYSCRCLFYWMPMLNEWSSGQAKPSQAKVLTGGKDLREAQVDVPLSVSHSCVWPHSWAH